MKRCMVITMLLLPMAFMRSWAQNTELDYLSLLDKAMYMERATLKMEMYKDDKKVRQYEMDFYRSDHKMRMEFTAPAVEKGRRMLNDNASLWMYLPRTSKVMKLPFKQSFMGSDASNSDLMRMSFKVDYELTEVGGVNDEGMMVLKLKAKDLDVAYPAVTLLYDKRRNVPLKQEMYSLSGKLIKTILYEDIIREGDGYMPSTMIIKEALQKNTLTKLLYSNIQKKQRQPAEFFTLGSLRR
ncbi:MAG: outer membrane lipoprotein-sorting protein [Mediterranea sp.]|nr:outer membrane lipoprotein-sorting protein [Mediterranea sp.]